MSRKAILSVLVIAALVGLNVFFYAGAASTGTTPVGAAPTGPRLTPQSLAAFNFSTTADAGQTTAGRDLFAIKAAIAPIPAPVPEPEIITQQPTAPDPKEVAIESARVNMLNVRVTGILSSQSGLSILVNAPFYNGIAFIGSEIGNGITISAIRRDRVKIAHSDLDLEREIMVLE